MPLKNENNFLKNLQELQEDAQGDKDRNYAQKLMCVLFPTETKTIKNIFLDAEDPYPLNTLADSLDIPSIAYLRASRRWAIANLAAFLKKPGGSAWKAMQQARKEDGDNALIAFPITGLGDVLMGSYPKSIYSKELPWSILVSTPNNTVSITPVKIK